MESAQAHCLNISRGHKTEKTCVTMGFGGGGMSSKIVVCTQAGFSQWRISNVRVNIFRQDFGNHVGRHRNADFPAAPLN
jgi:hypothetical protein